MPTCIALLITGASPAVAQDVAAAAGLAATAGATPDASWMAAYDAVAWVTTDSLRLQPPAVLQKLGPEWFCDTIDGLWHAFYGRYDTTASRYQVAAHFEREGDGFRLSTSPVDSARLDAAGAAIFHTRTRLPASFQPRGLRFNTFVRFVTRDSIDVWVLPAFQPNGILVYGGEARYRWDATGTRPVDSTLINNGFRWVRPDTSASVVFEEPNLDYPTAGYLFYLLAYSRYFKKLAIRTRLYYTVLYTTPEGKVFMSAVRDTAAAH